MGVKDMIFRNRKGSLAATADAAAEARLRASSFDATARFGLPLRALYSGFSAAESYLTDSTGDDLSDMFLRRADDFARLAPGVGIKRAQFDTNNQDMGALVTHTVGTIQRHGASGDEHLYFPSGDATTRARKLVAANMVASWTSPNVDIAVDFSPATVLGLDQVLLSNYAASPALGPIVAIGSNGTLRLESSVDGSTGATTLASTAAMPLANGGRIVGRITVTAGGVARFYTGTSLHAPLVVDGNGVPTNASWTKLGNDVAAPATVYRAVQDWFVGGRGGNSRLLIGSVFGVAIRDGISGPIVNPQRMDSWQRVNGASADVLRGSPTLYMLAGSQSGSDIDSYLASSAARVKKALLPFGALNHIIISFGHNHIFDRGEVWLAKVDALCVAIKARCPRAPISFVRQNPAKGAWTEYDEGGVLRGLELAAYAMQNNYGLVDVFEAFRNFGDYSVLLDSDGPHPTNEGGGVPAPNGSSVAADAIMAQVTRWLP